MFHGAHLRMRRATQPSALHSFFGSVNTGNKQPFRRGVLFASVAGVLMLTGGILTWLGFSDTLGNSQISTTGPLLIVLALLLFLISIRHFLIARKQTLHNRELERFSGGAIAAVVINRDEGDNTVTVIMDTLNDTVTDLEVARPQVICQPPSYIEATESSMSSAPDYQLTEMEPPPSYEEAMQEPPDPNQHSNSVSIG